MMSGDTEPTNKYISLPDAIEERDAVERLRELRESSECLLRERARRPSWSGSRVCPRRMVWSRHRPHPKAAHRDKVCD